MQTPLAYGTRYEVAAASSPRRVPEGVREVLGVTKMKFHLSPGLAKTDPTTGRPAR